MGCNVAGVHCLARFVAEFVRPDEPDFSSVAEPPGSVDPPNLYQRKTQSPVIWCCLRLHWHACIDLLRPPAQRLNLRKTKFPAIQPLSVLYPHCVPGVAHMCQTFRTFPLRPSPDPLTHTRSSPLARSPAPAAGWSCCCGVAVCQVGHGEMQLWLRCSNGYLTK